MEYFDDGESTPRPLRVVNTDVDQEAERTPYIPRRKSSSQNSSDEDVLASATSVSKHESVASSSGVNRRSHRTYLKRQRLTRPNYQADSSQSRFPIDGYDPPYHEPSSRTSLQSKTSTNRHPSTASSSSTGGILTRVLSSLSLSHTRNRYQPASGTNSPFRVFGSVRIRGPGNSMRESSMASNDSEFSSRDETVRRHRLPHPIAEGGIRDSPNPLRAPPSFLPNSGADKLTVAAELVTMLLETLHDENSTKIASITYPTLQVMQFSPQAASFEATEPRYTWLIVDASVQQWYCTRTYRNLDFSPSDLAATNNPGFLTKANFNLSEWLISHMIMTLGSTQGNFLSQKEHVTCIFQLSSATGDLGNTQEDQQQPTSAILTNQNMRAVPPQVAKVKLNYCHSMLGTAHQLSTEREFTLSGATEQAIDAEETNMLASGIDSGLRIQIEHYENIGSKAIPQLETGIQIMKDFAKVAQGLAPFWKASLKTMMELYQAVLFRLDDTAYERHEPQVNIQLFSETLEPLSPLPSSSPASRRGVDLDRASHEFQEGLIDITNRTKQIGRCRADYDPPIMGMNGAMDLYKSVDVPAPLFSPKSRGAKAGPDVENVKGVRDGDGDADGNEKVRMIWEKIRIGSEGSGDASALWDSDEDSRIVGAPWL